MQKKVIFRERQEMPSEDLNNLQDWADEAQRNLQKDAISPERQFIGLTVSMRSATEIEVAPGRLYDGTTGKVFELAESRTISVFSQVPFEDQKWLTVSVFGYEEETDIQVRDYEIDVTTGQTQPDAKPMQARRVIETHVAQGLESPTPERPEPPTGYTAIAQVRLSPSGIQQIVVDDSHKLPNLHAVNTRVRVVEGWQTEHAPRISALISGLAGLGKAVSIRATTEQLIQVAIAVADLKNRSEIPDNYIWFGGDNYLDARESNIAAVGYSAWVFEGLRPPLAATTTTALSLFNPIDPAAKVSGDGFALPAYTESTRLRIENYKDSIRINQYQYQSQAFTQITTGRKRITYGESRTYCTNSAFWSSGAYDPTTGLLRFATGETWEVAAEDRARALLNHQFVRLTHYTETMTEPYWDIATTNHTLNGSILAQTILMAQTGWISSAELFFAEVDPSAGLTLMLTEVSRGQPDMDKVIARFEFAANALTEGWCKLTFSRPCFVKAGQRYALVVSTGAQHKVGCAEGVEYTQGVLLNLQDGIYLNDPFERDLMLRLNFAKFAAPRTVLQMTSLQLAGGIGDLDMLYETIVPDGTELHWEYQVAGIWYPLNDRSASNLRSLPNLLPLRAVFVGTTDVMPGISLTNSQVIASRPGTAFTHFSTMRTLATPSDTVKVRILLEEFDAAHHTVGCQLIISGTPVDPDSNIEEVVDARGTWREYLFELGSTTTEYAIKLTGSTDAWWRGWHVAARYDFAL